MYDICLFSGTTEGRTLAQYLQTTRLNTLVCVATDYGETLSPKGEHLQVRTGRMDREAMADLFRKERFGLVVDATHPHAQVATDTILNAAQATGTSYLRLLRETSNQRGALSYADSITQAAQQLVNSKGNILITTGSKELAPYTIIKGYAERIFVRVLPTQEALTACASNGFLTQNIIAMQGPFSEDLNRALIRDFGIRHLVTKESGPTGGLPEKLAAAQAEGVHVVLIGRPPQVPGKGLENVIRYIQERFSLSVKPQVHLISMGMGNPAILTGQAQDALQQADCLIGAPRLLAAFADRRPQLASIDPKSIHDFLSAHPQYQRPAVLYSGDVGFYSGAKKLLPLLSEFEVAAHPGISSLQALCAKVNTAWDDAQVISLHGRYADIAMGVAHHAKVFVLVGGMNGVQALCKRLDEAGLGEVQIYVGERLSYPDECITKGSVKDLQYEVFQPLSAVLLLNPHALPAGSAHLPDEAFIRQTGDQLIPMTKAEVRAVAIAKLQLPPDAVVYDVGAGTGSVAIEMARACLDGRVYAIEGREDACALIQQNAMRHGCHNLQVVAGWAPDACADLPAPTHAFVGGSSGNLEAILRMLLAKNPNARIVLTLIALESISDALRCMESLRFQQVEMVQLQVSKARQAGRYHLMTAQNPVMMITCQSIQS